METAPESQSTPIRQSVDASVDTPSPFARRWRELRLQVPFLRHLPDMGGCDHLTEEDAQALIQCIVAVQSNSRTRYRRRWF